ncbi:MAG: DoxX family membrane protein [Prevotella sp.]|nr:DoxX family membrane protein [Prevotella sp.]
MKYVKLIFRLLLGAFMTNAGISHLTFNRQEFVAQVPTWLQFSPGFTDFVVLASGVVEIAFGLGIIFLVAKKRAIAGALLALFYVAIFPGNINQYVNHINAFGLNTDNLRLIRLFFQPVLIFLALWTTGGWKYWKLWAKGKFKE